MSSVNNLKFKKQKRLSNKILSQMAKQNILNSQLLLTKIGENTISIENLVHSTLSVSETVYNYYLKNSFQLLIEKPFIF